MTSASMTAVERSGLITQGADLLADRLRELYVDHTAMFSFLDADRVGRVRRAAAGGLSAGLLHFAGFRYTAGVALLDSPTAVVCRSGFEVVSAGREERRVARGEVFLSPDRVPYTTTADEGEYLLLGVARAAVGSLAAEVSGVTASSLRFEAMTPVSPAQQRKFARTAEFICERLVASEITEMHPLQVAEMTRLTAAAFLATFPNTALTAGYQAGPGWVETATIRRAAEFIDANAAQVLTVEEVAAAAEVSTTALHYAFCRHFGTTPTGYLRSVRLDRAREDLRSAAPAGSSTVAAVARRWGWVSVSQFTVAYRRRFGELPGQAVSS